MRALVILTTVILFLAGCAPVISNQSLRLVDRKVTFAELRRDPDRFAGKFILLGGVIAGVRNTNAGGELEIVQFATDEDGEIENTTRSGGRFIARSPGLIDPAIYLPGLLITVVGEVKGQEIMLLDRAEYNYPIIAICEDHIWKPEEISRPPSFHFGLGIGTVIH